MTTKVEGHWGRSISELPNIPSLPDLVGSWDRNTLMTSESGEWPCFNPSIFQHNHGTKAIVRSSNYLIEGGKYFIYGTDFQTVNYMVDVSDALTAHNRRVIRISSPQLSYAQNRIEDCRLFGLSGNLMMICTIYEQINHAIHNTIHLCQIDEDGSIRKFWRFDSPFGRMAEKNWMPVVIDDQIYIVYSIHPYRLIRMAPDLSSMVLIDGQSAIPDLQGHSGSSCAVPYLDGYLGVFHCRYVHEGVKKYSHRFVRFARDMRILAYSDEFVFEDFQIEFCAGLTQVGDHFLISYGVQDRRAMLARFPVDAIAPLLSRPS